MGVMVLVGDGVSVTCVGVAVMVAEGVMVTDGVVDGVKLGAGLGKVNGVWDGVADIEPESGVGAKVGMICAALESSVCWQPATDSPIIAESKMMILAMSGLIIT